MAAALVPAAAAAAPAPAPALVPVAPPTTPAPAPATPGKLSIEDLAEVPFFSSPVLSPDGKRIAAQINVGGKAQLAIYEIASGTTAEPKFVPLGGDAPRWFKWAGNDRLLISYLETVLQAGPGFFAIFPATRLKRYDLPSGKLMAVGAALGMIGDDVVFKDPSGRYILLSSQFGRDDTPSVQRIDLETGTSVEVQKKMRDVWKWFADEKGYVRGGITYAEDGFTIYYRDAPNEPLKRTGKGRIRFPDSTLESVQILPGSNAGLMVTNAPTGRFGVYRYELGSPEVGTPVFEHPEVDVTSYQLTPDRSKVEAVFWEDDRPRVKWMDPELERIQARIDRTLKGKDNLIVDRSRDGNIMLVWSGGADDPGTYYLYDRAAKRMNAFASPYEKLIDAHFSPVKPIRYTARDGLGIPGYLTLPARRDPKGLPLIVMPHGGPFARDSYGFQPWVQLLADRGYAVLQPNFRGSTGYGRAFLEKGYGAWGTAMQDDLDDGVAWLVRDGIVDPARVCIMGASYGGYAALWGAIRNPKTYRCAISFAGVTDIRAMLKYDSNVLMPGRYSREWRKHIQGEENRDLASVSPLQQAARLTVPVLIAHGRQDSNVPFQQGADMVKALRKKGAPVFAAYYRREGHGFDRTEDSLDFLRRVEAFLEVYNPADPSVGKGPRAAQRVSGAVDFFDYPAAAFKKKQQGTVEIGFVVTADGRVVQCKAETSSGFAELDKQACDIAEERYQYRPARAADGSYVASRDTDKVIWALPPAKEEKSAKP
jgi:TonB family protein